MDFLKRLLTPEAEQFEDVKSNPSEYTTDDEMIKRLDDASKTQAGGESYRNLATDARQSITDQFYGPGLPERISSEPNLNADPDAVEFNKRQANADKYYGPALPESISDSLNTPTKSKEITTQNKIDFLKANKPDAPILKKLGAAPETIDSGIAELDKQAPLARTPIAEKSNVIEAQSSSEFVDPPKPMPQQGQQDQSSKDQKQELDEYQQAMEYYDRQQMLAGMLEGFDKIGHAFAGLGGMKALEHDPTFYKQMRENASKRLEQAKGHQEYIKSKKEQERKDYLYRTDTPEARFVQHMFIKGGMDPKVAANVSPGGLKDSGMDADSYASKMQAAQMHSDEMKFKYAQLNQQRAEALGQKTADKIQKTETEERNTFKNDKLYERLNTAKANMYGIKNELDKLANDPKYKQNPAVGRQAAISFLQALDNSIVKESEMSNFMKGFGFKEQIQQMMGDLKGTGQVTPKVLQNTYAALDNMQNALNDRIAEKHIAGARNVLNAGGDLDYAYDKDIAERMRMKLASEKNKAGKSFFPKAEGAKPQVASGMVAMIDPRTGKRGVVPQDKVKEAEKDGMKRVE